MLQIPAQLTNQFTTYIGQQDRTVPIPDSLLNQLTTQLQRVIALHEEDCRSGYSGVFLPNLLEVKYKNAARELVWQWFFPAKQLTIVEKNSVQRRYHVHDSLLQKSLRTAVKKANITKRVTSHTFRHYIESGIMGSNAAKIRYIGANPRNTLHNKGCSAYLKTRKSDSYMYQLHCNRETIEVHQD